MVTHSDSSLLTLRMCAADDHIHVRAFSKSNGDVLYLMATEKGNHGQAWEYDFAVLHVSTRSISPESAANLDFKRPKDNDFLTSDDKLPPGEDFEAIVTLQPDGRLEAHPWTWMQPQWENRKPAWEIYFEWNGRTFTKVRKSAT